VGRARRRRGATAGGRAWGQGSRAGRTDRSVVEITAARADDALARLATHRQVAPVRLPPRLIVALEAAASVFLDHRRGSVPGPLGALAHGSGLVRAPALECCALIEAALDTKSGPMSLTDSARQAAQMSRARPFDDRSGRVGRALLAAWPATYGPLDRVPVPLSRSLADAGVGSPLGLDIEDHVVLLLSALGDAAERMLAAEIHLCRLRDNSIRQLERRGE
jgi:hypothetical protein